MPTHKITPSDRKLLVDLWAQGRRKDARQLAESLGVSRYYACLLYQRGHHPIPSRKAPQIMSTSFQNGTENI